jgi:hypothetical protein
MEVVEVAAEAEGALEAGMIRETAQNRVLERR